MSAAGDAGEILRSRARALARPMANAASAATIEIVELRVAQERYALETRHVLGVSPLRQLTPLPGVPAFVLGIVSLRGHVVPVLDIRRFFELPQPGLNDLHDIVLVAGGGLEFGLMTDAVVGVYTLAVDALQPPPPNFTGIRSAYLKGVTAQRLVVLDLERVFADPAIVVHQDGDA